MCTERSHVVDSGQAGLRGQQGYLLGDRESYVHAALELPPSSGALAKAKFIFHHEWTNRCIPERAYLRNYWSSSGPRGSPYSWEHMVATARNRLLSCHIIAV